MAWIHPWHWSVSTTMRWYSGVPAFETSRLSHRGAVNDGDVVIDFGHRFHLLLPDGNCHDVSPCYMSRMTCTLYLGLLVS